MKKAVLSLSGGMDSTSLLLYLLNKNYEVRCYSFRYGQKHRCELNRALKNTKYLQSKGFKVTHNVINLKSVFSGSQSSLVNKNVITPEGHYSDNSMKVTVVENRNVIFASILFGKALAWAKETNSDVNICLGMHSGDHAIYPDCTLRSVNQLEVAFKVSNWDSEKVNYYIPYMKWDKGDIINRAFKDCLELELDFTKIFHNTITCYSPNSRGKSCGKCGSCTERIEAFKKFHIKDPTLYFTNVEKPRNYVKK